MGKFGVVSDLLSSASVAKVGKDMDTVWIPRELIRKNPKNGYEISGVEPLAEDIARSGLAQPLEVMPQDDGSYMLITGERRLTALDMLRKQGVWTKHIPCYVRPMDYYDIPLPDKGKEMYAILRTNCLTRDKSDADLFFEVTEWGKIISELKQKGYKQLSTDSGDISLQGRTREITAARVHTSTGQVAKIERIQKYGHKKLQEAVRAGRISIAAAYSVSQMTREKQDELLKATSESGTISQKDVDMFMKASEHERGKVQKDTRSIPPAEAIEISTAPDPGKGKLPKLKNDSQRREWLRNYKDWGMWYRDPNIDVNYYRFIFEDGTELIAAEYPQRKIYSSRQAEDEVFFHLLDKKIRKLDGKIYNDQFCHQFTNETYLIDFLRTI